MFFFTWCSVIYIYIYIYLCCNIMSIVVSCLIIVPRMASHHSCHNECHFHRTFVRFLFNFHRTFVGLLSDFCRTFVELSSNFCPSSSYSRLVVLRIIIMSYFILSSCRVASLLYCRSVRPSSNLHSTFV
jgi:hypothetical protein